MQSYYDLVIDPAHVVGQFAFFTTRIRVMPWWCRCSALLQATHNHSSGNVSLAHSLRSMIGINNLSLACPLTNNGNESWCIHFFAYQNDRSRV